MTVCSGRRLHVLPDQTLHRFFISPERIAGDVVEFPPDLSRQMHRVLRMSAGDPVVALDNTGYEYAVALSSVDSARTLGRITGRTVGSREPRFHLTLYQAAMKSDRFEWALQKGTELGVGRFVPVVTLRTMRRDASPSSNRRDRWMRIIREAAEQSERSVLPELGEPVLLKEALGRAPRPMILAWEQESKLSMRSAFDGLGESWGDGRSLSAFVGPVGGFDPEEIELARSRGAVTVSLGRRVLRAETAAIVLVTAIMHELGELGPYPTPDGLRPPPE